MAFVITDACTACGLCIPECPIEAVHVGDPIYVIDDTCCDFEECVAACPEDAIVPEEDAEAVTDAGTDKSSDPPGEAHL